MNDEGHVDVGHDSVAGQIAVSVQDVGMGVFLLLFSCSLPYL